MSARLPLQLLWAVLLALAAAHPTKNVYVTVSGKSNITELRAGPRFYMHDEQCLAYIPPSFMCGAWRSLGVEVRISDRVAYPMVEVDDLMLNVSLARRPDAFGVCRGVAHVDTRLRCEGHHHHPHSKTPRPLPSRLLRSGENDE